MILSKKENAYFAACNSGHGFVNYFPECFEDEKMEKRFILKGGPGTGKSRFLRTVSECGQTYGWNTEMIYCSSDPGSLDGVILRKRDRMIGLLDGTAPHTFECLQPGFRDNIIDLGIFWNAGKLAAKKDKILYWNQQKKAAYREGYRFLSGYEQMHVLRDEVLLPFVKRTKLQKSVLKYMREVSNGSGFSLKTALMRAFSMDGQVMLDSLFYKGKNVFLIEDCHGISRYFTDEICKIAKEREQPIRISVDPVMPDFIDGVFLTDVGVGFVVQKGKENLPLGKTIRMRKFLDIAAAGSVRPKITYAERMMRAMASGAEEWMQNVKRAHFELEHIYGAAMDFDAKEKFTENFCRTLFEEDQ